MPREIVEVPGLSARMRQFNVPVSLVTRGAGLIFVSGLTPMDKNTGEFVKGDIETQTDAALDVLRHCLAAAGATFDDVLMIRLYAAKPDLYGAINRAYARHFPHDPPARTFVPVLPWPMDIDLEIDCVSIDTKYHITTG